MRAVVPILVLLLVGCHGERDAWEARYDAIVAEADRAAAAVSLPEVTGAEARPSGAARILVTTDAVVVDASHTRARTFRAGTELQQTEALPPAPRSVAHLDPAQAEIALAPSGVDDASLENAAVLVDRAVDALTLLRVLDAIGRTYHVTRVVLRVGGDGTAGIPLVLGSYVRSGDRADQPEDMPLELEAYVRPEGLELEAAGGTIAPGCDTIGAADAITVADGEGGVDRDRVRTCIERVLREFPDERQVYVSAAPGISSARLVAALVALLGEPPHGLPELLPISRRVDRSDGFVVPAGPGVDPRVDEMLRGAFGEEGIPEGLLVPGS